MSQAIFDHLVQNPALILTLCHNRNHRQIPEWQSLHSIRLNCSMPEGDDGYKRNMLMVKTSLCVAPRYDPGMTRYDTQELARP